MRSPENVLKSLSEKAKNKEYRYERLYRNLYNPEFYLLAYQNIATSQGSMTAGADGLTLDGMSMERIEKLIAKLRDHSYQPNPARRVYIAKKNSNKKRPLGIPSTDDKLLQEVVRMILEAIYEPTFSDNSHGFRPKRSCHTALKEVVNEEFSLQHDRNPIESIKSRLKSPSSIMNKMQKRGLPLDFPTMQANIMDIAGVRVICSFEEDVFFLAKCLKKQSDIEIITEKDYISHPKPNGYRSLHLTIRLPVFFAEKEIHVPVEIQLRTIAMDFWASLEHTIRYKKNLPINAEVETELKECADSSREWDGKMEHLLHILT